jgi:hypothetical protein
MAKGEDLRAFQVRQREQGVQPPTMNGAEGLRRRVGKIRGRSHGAGPFSDAGLLRAEPRA